MRGSGEVTSDRLSELLGELRFRSAVFAKVSVTPPWGIEVPLLGRAMFHFVAEGRCMLDVEGVEGPRWLSEGDLVIMPHGHVHVMRDAPGSPSQRIDDLLKRYRIGDDCLLRFGDGQGPGTSLVCGGFWFEDTLSQSLLRALPRVMHLQASKPGFEWLRLSQELITRELSSGRPGASALAARIADAVFIEATRSHFAEVHGDSDAWAASMRDPAIGVALTLMHRDVRKRWTVAGLAKGVGLSRSAFAVRFRGVAGEAPLQYLSRHRIEKAARLLRSSNAGVAEIAQQVGYDSEAAFCRAFGRRMGLPPAAFRKRPG